MFSYQVYKVLHILGLSLVVLSLGGILGHVANGGTKATNQLRKVAAISHGVGLLLVLLGGFGMLAKLEIHSFPAWVSGKLIIWLLLGAFVAVAYKRQALAKKLWFAVPLLVLLATILAVYGSRQ
jgi:hypothetical protein